MKSAYSAVTLAAALLLLTTPSACKGETPVRISFTGDIIMHIPVKTAAAQNNKKDTTLKTSLNNNGFDHLFEPLKSRLKKSDILMGNLEFPVAPPYTSKPRIFNCPPQVLQSLKDTGFTMVTLANNHMLDQGTRGVAATINHVEKAGLQFIGVHRNEALARRGLVVKKQGIRIGFLAYTGVSNYPIPRSRSFHINWFYHKKKVLKDIEEIKKRCDYLILTVHTGVEYALKPQKRDTALMKAYAEAGVDLIIGHHPHIIQPVEKITCKDGRSAYIFYSLGNFISNQSSTHPLPARGLATSTRDSILVTCLLKKDNMRIIPEFEVTPILTRNTRDRRTWKRTIQTWTIDDFKASLKKSPDLTQKNYRVKKTLKGLAKRTAALYHIINGAGSYKEITIKAETEKAAN